MYSPKIAPRLIPPLYHLGRSQHRPMTVLVAEAVELYLLAQALAGEPTERIAA